MINNLVTYDRGNKIANGVWMDGAGKFRAEMKWLGKKIRIGKFETMEEAASAYKNYKETFLHNIAEKQKQHMPYQVYKSLSNWTVWT